jgi:hypothetical protein
VVFFEAITVSFGDSVESKIPFTVWTPMQFQFQIRQSCLSQLLATGANLLVLADRVPSFEEVPCGERAV